MKHNFGERKEEMGMPVWQSPKYLSSKEKAIEMIESNKYGLSDADFWILMNKTKTGKMAYTGLIISHTGCLKINDKLEDELKFKEEYCSDPIKTEKGYRMDYRDKRDGMYEVGEISNENCTNAYPFAMLLKRTMDRVILKKSKLAFYGVYSDSESEEFKDNNVGSEESVVQEESLAKKYNKYSQTKRKEMLDRINANKEGKAYAYAQECMKAKGFNFKTCDDSVFDELQKLLYEEATQTGEFAEPVKDFY